MIGRNLSHYQVLEKIGEGGMGVVYKARDTHLDRFVALKVLPAEKTADPERKRRFVQEAKAASALNHPNIITIYDIDAAEGVDYIAMEFVAGKSLDHLVDRGGMPLREALKCAVQIADALAAAHAAGIVHRDVKPANVMVTDRGLVKVLDFGLAKLAEPEADEDGATRTMAAAGAAAGRTQEGAILGTIAYMSPEQAEAKKLDARSDIFSFGSVLYEMVTGRHAFTGDSRLSTLAAILHKEPRPVREGLEIPPPRQLEKLIGRCLRKDPRERLQLMDDVKIALEDIEEADEPATIVPAEPPRRRWSLAAMAAVGAGVLGAGIGWWIWGRAAGSGPAPPPPSLRRLTSDSGLTIEPALSPDGKLLAYASDRAGEGNLDIWVQQIAGGEAIRLTREPTDERDPSFSPDGSRIAFRSEREGGGIYVVSSLGGEARKIAAAGRRPRFSPDGRQIACWVGMDVPARGSSRISLVSSGGGNPSQFQAEFENASAPVWSPDGSRLLFQGIRGGSAVEDRSSDWWLAGSNGGEAVRTGVYEVFRRAGLSAWPSYSFVPVVWTAPDNEVLFAARTGDSVNLWKIRIAPDTGRIAGPPQPFTFGAGVETDPSAVAGAVAFASRTATSDLWGIPLDSQGRARGEARRITQDPAVEMPGAHSADGKKFVYTSARSGNFDVWLKDMVTGKETAVAFNTNHMGSSITADGATIGYATGEGISSGAHVLKLGATAAQKVCDDCRNVWDWSPDGSVLLHSGQADSVLVALDVASGRSVELVKRPGYNSLRSRFSPDGRWIAFHSRSGARARTFIIPFRREGAVNDADWIPAPGGEWSDSLPHWSADGQLLYFVSDRDGKICLWAHRLEPATKRPLGAAFAVSHFHDPRRLLAPVPTRFAMSATRDQLVLSIDETLGNIWMAGAGAR